MLRAQVSPSEQETCSQWVQHRARQSRRGKGMVAFTLVSTASLLQRSTRAGSELGSWLWKMGFGECWSSPWVWSLGACAISMLAAAADSPALSAQGAHPPSGSPAFTGATASQALAPCHLTVGNSAPANALFSINNASSLLWFCSALIHIYWFGGLIPLIFLPLFAQLQLPLVICNELHENKEWMYEKDMKTMTEQDSHYRCLFLIPEHQTQTAFVSHTLLIWQSPKLISGDKNPSIDFSTFQSRSKAGEVTSYKAIFPLFSKEPLKSHF